MTSSASSRDGMLGAPLASSCRCSGAVRDAPDCADADADAERPAVDDPGSDSCVVAGRSPVTSASSPDESRSVGTPPVAPGSPSPAPAPDPIYLRFCRLAPKHSGECTATTATVLAKLVAPDLDPNVAAPGRGTPRAVAVCNYRCTDMYRCHGATRDVYKSRERWTGQVVVPLLFRNSQKCRPLLAPFSGQHNRPRHIHRPERARAMPRRRTRPARRVN